MRRGELEDLQADSRTEGFESAKDPMTDFVLGVVFLVGGVYMVFAFSSFWVFVIGFFCVVLGVSMTLSGVPSSVGDSLPRLDGPSRSPGAEREVLRVLSRRGPTSPAEAAVEAALSVREADATLSELASRGHLKVESRGGTLFYSIPRLGPDFEEGDSLEGS